jgi:hypothetical protein
MRLPFVNRTAPRPKIAFPDPDRDPDAKVGLDYSGETVYL